MIELMDVPNVEGRLRCVDQAVGNRGGVSWLTGVVQHMVVRGADGCAQY